jgi:isoquinoline 1-oxidoreductase
MNAHNKPAARAGLDRRSFLIGTGTAGLVMGFIDPLKIAGGVSEAMAANSFAPSPWYMLTADGGMTVYVGKAEMGQHVGTALAQIIAEELELDWRKVKLEYPDSDPKYNDPVLGALITGGSWSVFMNFDTMSRAGAAGRMTLIDAGAKAMAVPAAECTANNSRIVHKSGKSVSYGELVTKGVAPRAFTADEMKAIKLKTPEQYKVIGRSVDQLDIPSKSDGTAKYGIDAFVPNMVYGKPVVPPVRYGATVKSVDDSAAKKVKGYVKTVTLNDKTGTVTGWVVVVANTYPAAKKAAEALKVTYDMGPNAKVSSESLLAEAKRLQADGSKALPFVKVGDTAAAMGGAAKTIEAEYTTEINIHAPLEPMNALVYNDGKAWHVHSGNQFPTRSIGVMCGAMDVDPKTVIHHQYVIGGGFGRRLDGDMMVVAGLTAKDVGRPVKLIYGREDDMQMDFTRPLTFQKVKLGTDASGKIVAMEHDVVSAWPTARWGIPAFLTPSLDEKKTPYDAFTVNGADHWYSIPNHLARTYLNEMAQAATPSGQLRSVAPGWTFWAVESMLDELAASLGKDPVELRLAMLDGAGSNAGGAQRLANTLRTAVGRSGYGVAKMPKGTGMGVACVSAQERNAATWTACVAKVAVDAKGNVNVQKLTLAMDVGTAVNPDGVKAQIEGSALWGLSLAMLEEAKMKDGALDVTNFDSYAPMRLSGVPDIDISIIANGLPASGCGEPAVTVIAPAVANAIYNAVGARVRSLPITAKAVQAAMKA